MKTLLITLLVSMLLACSSSYDTSQQNNIIIEKSIPKDTTQTPTTNIKAPKDKENKSASTQCLGTTKKGNRCNNKVVGDGYCHLHK